MSYSSDVLALSPIIYLRLGETSGTTAVDSSGNGHDGTYTGPPTLGVTGALVGDTDKAATFSGSVQDVNVAFFSGLNITTFTLACWVKTTATNQAIIGRRGTTGAPYILLVDTTGKLQLTIKTTGTTGPNYNSTGSTINNGVWRFIAVTRDNATGDVKFYIDGVLDTTVTGTSAPGVATSNGFAVASRGGTPYLNGSVDEPMLVGTALTGSQIAALYATGSGILAAAGTAALSLSASGGAGATGSGSASLSLSASGGTSAPTGGTASLSLSAAGALVPPTPAAGAATLALSASGGASGSPGGTASLNLTATGAAFAVLAASGSATLTLTAAGSAVMSTGGSATLTLSAGGVALVLYGTDISNAFDGLDVVCVATVTLTRTAAAAPPGLVPGLKVDKAVPLPVPVMDGGRPT